VKENPDVIFLQEIYFSSDRNFIIKAFSEKGYKEVFSCKHLLFISRISFKNPECISLSNQGSLLSWAILDGIYKKSFQVVDIKVDGEEITLVNMHLLSTYGFDNNNYQSVRKAQLMQIENHLRGQGKKRIIMGGDFNFALGSVPYTYAISELGYTDPLANNNEHTTTKENTTRLLFGHIREERIDHFFVKGFNNKAMTGKIVCNTATLINGKPHHPSDHYGVLLTIV